MNNVTLGNDRRTLNRPAWNSASLNSEKPIATHTPDAKPAPIFCFPGMAESMEPQLNRGFPAFAYLRTTRAVYTRCLIIAETRENIQVSYFTVNRKGFKETKTDTVDKRDIRTFRVYKED